jgi:hypothetical protein
MLSNQTIQELRDLLQEDGFTISLPEASIIGRTLVDFFDVLSKNCEGHSRSPPDPP